MKFSEILWKILWKISVLGIFFKFFYNINTYLKPQGFFFVNYFQVKISEKNFWLQKLFKKKLKIVFRNFFGKIWEKFSEIFWDIFEAFCDRWCAQLKKYLGLGLNQNFFKTRVPKRNWKNFQASEVRIFWNFFVKFLKLFGLFYKN